MSSLINMTDMYGIDGGIDMYRKIDVLVAEKVMGYEVSFIKTLVADSKGNPMCEPLPHYSTDLAAAGEILDKLYSEGIRIYTATSRENRWRVVIGVNGTYAMDKTLPGAISRAALKFMGMKDI